MHRPSEPARARLVSALAPLVACAPLIGCAGHPTTKAEAGVPWPVEVDTWRDDRAWYDGQAEVAFYDATRVIYGEPRAYRATAYTNKQWMDPATTTKSTGDAGVEVFKHHWSERVPTERYDYDFSTAVFVRTDDLSTFKWTCSTQEDCGASFKQAWTADDGWRLLDSVYFPEGGVLDERRPGALPLPVDALTLVLRDHPVDATGAPTRITVLPSQRDTRRVPWTPVERVLIERGAEIVEVPFGSVQARRIDLAAPGADAPLASYWFAADDGAPMLGALVRYEDSGGSSYELVSLERYPYWARGPR